LENTILINDEAETVPHRLINGTYRIIPATVEIPQYRPIEVTVDVGAIHFRGEIADFYVLFTDCGRLMDIEKMNAILYFEGKFYDNLTGYIQHVSTGLYRMSYTIPSDAEAGTYTLLVKAEYLEMSGASLKSFLVSPTFADSYAKITKIENDVATIIIPSLNQITANLTVIKAQLVSISGDIATVNTTLGLITTNIENLNLKVTKIDGDIATVQTSLGTIEGIITSIQGDTAEIKTDVGNIEVKVSGLPENVQTSLNLLYATLILALIAAIGAMLAVFYLKKK